ncbi:MAG: DUF4349 domain-containing protein [Ktedonobacteraceae bacterium]|nr:DUF4349 domain-containing protein [Ktedonobacteraceae bacterium]
MSQLWQQGRRHRQYHAMPKTAVLSLLFILIFFAGCGGSGTSSMPAPASSGGASRSDAGYSSSKSVAQGTTAGNAQPADKKNIGGPQYLIKTLKVVMAMHDTRKAANDLQSWISTTDPQSLSAGMSYSQASDNNYNITLTFAVRASIYPQIQRYLTDYASNNKGRLVSMQETVQDVTSDYVDYQSQLKNLRVEQIRLQELLKGAQTMSDILAIEQKLSDVEEKIEKTQARINTLNQQTTFYTVSIELQPIYVSTPSPEPQWSISQVFSDAFAGSLAFAQGLLTLLIWLLAYAVYIVPLAVIAWFAARWIRRRHIISPPPVAPKS